MRAIPAGHDGIRAVHRPMAAVSIIRCADPVDSILVLRRKKTSSDPWSGHFAFPGGKRAPNDVSIFHTCLRETREETGVSLDESLLALKLPVTRAGRKVMAPIQVQPYVFELPQRPEIIVEPAEIDSYLWLEVAKFVDKSRHSKKKYCLSASLPFTRWNDYFLWGFTYGLLCLLLELDIDL